VLSDCDLLWSIFESKLVIIDTSSLTKVAFALPFNFVFIRLKTSLNSTIFISFLFNFLCIDLYPLLYLFVCSSKLAICYHFIKLRNTQKDKRNYFLIITYPFAIFYIFFTKVKFVFN